MALASVLRRCRLPAAVLLFLGVAGLTAASVLRRPMSDRFADLHVYLGAVSAVRHGMSLYDYAAANGDRFTYPPFALLVLSPLGLLRQGVVEVGWTVLSLLAFVGIARVWVFRWPRVDDAARSTATWAVAAALLVSAPGQSNIRFGQISVFVALAALTDALGVVPRRYHGVLVGLAAAIKLTPALFIVFFLLTGRRKAAYLSAAVFALATAIAWVLQPSASSTYWSSAVFSTARIGDLAALGNQSVNGMMLRSGLPGQLRPLVWCVAVCVVVVAGLVRARALHRRGATAAAAVLVGCATLAASPVSWTHHQIWTVLAGMVLVGAPRRGQVAAGAVVLIAMTLSLADIAAHAGVSQRRAPTRRASRRPSAGRVLAAARARGGLPRTRSRRTRARTHRRRRALGRLPPATAHGPGCSR